MRKSQSNWVKSPLRSIKRVISIIVIIAAITPTIIIGIYFYSIIYTQQNEKIKEGINAFILNTNIIISSKFENINTVYFNFVNDSIINPSLSQDEENNGSLYSNVFRKDKIEKRMISYLNFNMIWNTGLIEAVSLIDKNREEYLIGRQSYTQSLIEQFKTIYNDHRLQEGTFTLLFPPSQYTNIFYARDFNDLDSGEYNGSVLFSIREEILTQEYDQMQTYDGTEIFIFTDEGLILSHSDKKMIGNTIPEEFMKLEKTPSIIEITYQDEKYLVAMQELNHRNVTSLIAIPKKAIFKILITSIASYLYIFIAILIIFIIIGIYVSSRIVNYINVLIKGIENVQQGDYKSKMRGYKIIEINKVSIIFNEMISYINHLINVVYKDKILIQEAEIKYLHAQINPHFLYNILTCIGYKAKMANDDSLYSMISYLSELMYARIHSDSNQKILIEEEMKLVNYYLFLQKERFYDKIQIDISNFNPELYSLFLPKFSIQTLVENAVEHGLEKKIGNGLISIKGYLRENTVYIEIIDNGVGFDPNFISSSLIYNDTEQTHIHSNIGIINTMKRIKLLYGNEFGIKIESRLNYGTKAVIHIPVDIGDNKNGNPAKDV